MRFYATFYRDLVSQEWKFFTSCGADVEDPAMDFEGAIQEQLHRLIFDKKSLIDAMCILRFDDQKLFEPSGVFLITQVVHDFKT